MDWRLRTACAAAAFGRALDEVAERRVVALMGLAEVVRRAAVGLEKALLGACRGVGEVLGMVRSLFSFLYLCPFSCPCGCEC